MLAAVRGFHKMKQDMKTHQQKAQQVDVALIEMMSYPAARSTTGRRLKSLVFCFKETHLTKCEEMHQPKHS